MRPLNTKIVGRRRAPLTPQEAHERAMRLEREMNLINPFPKPRGFVFKAPTWEAYEAWRKAQSNPRLW